MLATLSRKFVLFLLLLATACAHQPLPPAGTVEVIEAAPSKGFHYPYLLKLPTDARSTFLLVEPNNTGRVSDDFEVHADAAKQLANRAIGSYVAKRLDLPLLVPVFPRPETGWEMYTHALDRDTMLVGSGPMRRLDLQLLAMIDDARRRLRGYGVATEGKVLLTGFSASGTFANRFTLLHPGRVHAVASGGLNGIIIIPTETMPYPLGISDVPQLAGAPFREAAWRAVPQFIYMGAKDDNDAVLFDDGYSESERAIVFRELGEKMQPDRWTRVQQLYREAGANVTFRTYEHMGHGTDGTINDEIVEFFRKAIE